ncbi:MAG: outer membrane beta-barrel protein [Bacteroidota bacterium]
MRKIYVFAIALLCSIGLSAQDFGIGVSGSYLTELEGFGGTAELIYNIDENWGASTSFTYAVADAENIRSKWSIVDLNARYNVIDGFYVLAGGQYLSVNLRELGLGGGNPVSTERTLSESEFGFQAGAGYIYNLADNVNLFAEIRYASVNTGYVHGKLGILFDL